MEDVDGQLILVGDGSRRAALEEQAQSDRLEGRIHFAGTRADVRPFLSIACAVCLSSIDESQPIALLEAMAAGRPIVATRVGGVPEIIEDGETGLLVPPNDPGALAKALRKVAEDGVWRERAGERARERAEREFSIRERARKIAALFEDLLWESIR
jgi:glycosyltransferase involved in cell wall biosynthesis